MLINKTKNINKEKNMQEKEIQEKTFEQWMRKFSDTELLEIINHGAYHGFDNLFYTSELKTLFNAYKRDIWYLIIEDGLEDEKTSERIFNRICKDSKNNSDFEQKLVWYAAEIAARKIIKEKIN